MLNLGGEEVSACELSRSISVCFRLLLGACVHAPSFDSVFFSAWVGVVGSLGGYPAAPRAVPGVFRFCI